MEGMRHEREGRGNGGEEASVVHDDAEVARCQGGSCRAAPIEGDWAPVDPCEGVLAANCVRCRVCTVHHVCVMRLLYLGTSGYRPLTTHASNA